MQGSGGDAFEGESGGGGIGRLDRRCVPMEWAKGSSVHSGTRDGASPTGGVMAAGRQRPDMPVHVLTR